MKTKFLHKLAAVLFGMLLSASVYSQTGNVSGSVFYHNEPNAPLEDVFVSLLDGNGNVVEMTITDPNGNYTFYNVAYGSYDLGFSTTLPSGGRSIKDAHYIVLYIHGVIDFTATEFAAADVTADGDITMADFHAIIDYCVHGTPFQAEDWVFESTSVVVNGSGSRDGISTGGSSSGDVDGSWLPTSRDIPFANVTYNTTGFSNETVEIPLNINYNDAIGGFFLVLDYPAEDINITGVQTQMKDLNYQVFENQVKISWVDINLENIQIGNDPIITLTAEVYNDTDDIRIGINPESLVIDTKGNPIEEVEYTLPILHKQTFTADIDKLFPNPATTQINFNASFPEEGQIHICFYDMNAKLVKEIKSFEQAGFMNDQINVQDLQNGMYMYRISFKGKNFNFDTSDILLINR